ncbi:2-hydroxy-3-oxopropionate reductase [Alcaligenes sp. HPC1271]|nr:2-hydroxy-3-oxopropionate reductase [Alcaligenes sp. HPC1271]
MPLIRAGKDQADKAALSCTIEQIIFQETRAMTPSIQPKHYEPASPQKVAFIGLGVMGYPMAGHLAQAGHQVTVYNRNPAKAEQWSEEFKQEWAATPALAAAQADIVMACVGNDDDLRSIFQGPNGVLAGMRQGACLSTTPLPPPKWPRNWEHRRPSKKLHLSTPPFLADRRVPRKACSALCVVGKLRIWNAPAR